MDYANKLRELFFRDYLEDGEKIVFVAHKHVFAFLRDITRILGWHLVLPFLMWLFFPQLLPIYAVWAGIGFFRILFVFQDWYYDAWLLTNILKLKV